MKNRTRFFRLMIFALVLLCAGCITVCSRIQKDSSTGPNQALLQQVRPGNTTKEWVIKIFGKPSTETKLSGGKEILKYQYTKEKRSDVRFLFFFNSHSKKESTADVYFELKDGIVQKYWRD